MNRIREARKAKGLTLKDLGKKIGVAESTVSMYENGKREPDNATLVNISNILDVSVDYLLCKSESQNETKKEPAALGEFSGLTESEIQLLKSFRRCDPLERVRVLAYAEGVSDHL